MMDALTVRGPQDKDTIKPENGKSETEDGNSKSCSRRNLSKDHDRGPDSERTWRPRQDQTREWEIMNRRWKLEIPFSMESKQRLWLRLWPWKDFKRQTQSSQRTGNQRTGNCKQKMETRNPVPDRIKANIMLRLWPWEDFKRQTRSSQRMGICKQNLSKDHDGGSGNERTSRQRHNQARGQETREWKS